MKKEFNIKDKVWIHLGERKLAEGRVVEVIDLVHLKEGHSPDRELYVIEIKTGIDDIYEVRTWDQISPDARGPINLFRDLKIKNETVKGNRLLKRLGAELPLMENHLEEALAEIDKELKEDDDEIDPELIHAAIEKAQRDATHAPLNLKAEKPKRKFYNRKKKT